MNDERRLFCRLAQVAFVIAEEVRARLVHGNVWERAMGRGPTIPDPGHTTAQFSFEETEGSSAARLRLRFSVRVLHRDSLRSSHGALADSTEIEVGPDGVLIDGELLEDPDDPEELASLLRLGFGLPALGRGWGEGGEAENDEAAEAWDDEAAVVDGEESGDDTGL